MEMGITYLKAIVFKIKKNLFIRSQDGDYTSEQKKETNNKPLNKIRPKLSHDLLNGPILKNTKTRARLGKIAIDARLNPMVSTCKNA